jgi:hypothetical protein
MKTRSYTRRTPEVLAHVAAWDAQRRTLGTNKTKAAELGMSLKGFEQMLYRIRNGPGRRG